MYTNAKEAIAAAKERIEMAEAVYEDFESMETRMHGYVIVDDGQDRWIQKEDIYDADVLSVIEGVLSGEIKPDPNESYQPCYDRLCGRSTCLYSKIGSPSDLVDFLSGLREDDGLNLRQIEQIVDRLYELDSDDYAVWLERNTPFIV